MPSYPPGFPRLSYNQEMVLKKLVEKGCAPATSLSFSKFSIPPLIRKGFVKPIDGADYLYEPTELGLKWYQVSGWNGTGKPADSAN